MKNEKNAWFILLFFVFIVGFPIYFFNIYIDSANLLHYFHKDETEIADALIHGETVYFPKHPNERLCKEELIKKLPSHINTVAIGSSLLMTLNQDLLGLENGEFYNLGVSGMNLKDYLNTLGMMKIYNIDADTFIFLLHIDVFLPNTDSRHEFQDSYGISYLNYLNGYRVTKKDNSYINGLINKLKYSLSISYFRENLSFFLSHGKVKNFIVSGNHPEYAHYLSDGSWEYNENYKKRTIDDVYNDIKNNGKDFMHVGQYIDKDNVILFDTIITKLLDEGKTIILYFSPYCPSLYEEYPPKNSPCFKEIEDYIMSYSNKENITILGSFYPSNLGLEDNNYYDARHIRREDLYLAFKKIQ